MVEFDLDSSFHKMSKSGCSDSVNVKNSHSEIFSSAKIIAKRQVLGGQCDNQFYNTFDGGN